MSLAFQETLAVLELKEGIYSFLSSVFNFPPENKHLFILEDDDMQEVFRTIFIEPSRYLFRKHEIGEVRQDFNDLFMVPGNKYVKPYESVYWDEKNSEDISVKGLLMGPSTRKVQKFYAAVGFKLSEMCKELPDYLGVELQFMASLTGEQKRRALENKEVEFKEIEDLIQKFLRDHLGRWIREVCNEIYEKAETDFYKGVALLCRDFVLREMSGTVIV